MITGTSLIGEKLARDTLTRENHPTESLVRENLA